jgi:hypothetical protein
VRVLGYKPFRVMVLGPAASGKSMQCSILAERYGYCCLLLLAAAGGLHTTPSNCHWD